MMLPDSDRAHVDRSKITEYLLSLSHPGGGVRYTGDGLLQAPDGRTPKVRTVWIVEPGSRGPRLITAHPM